MASHSLQSSSTSAFQAAPIPQNVLGGSPNIQFLHPGYPDTTNRLLRLPRVDGTAATGFGVAYETALVACQIIANNAFQGWLAHDASGQRRIDTPDDGLLKDEKYYFFVDQGPTRYPIVPSFKNWQFPHRAIPEPWLVASLTASEDRPPNCAVTNYGLPTDDAHLVPKKEEKWFLKNDMEQYCEDEDSLKLIESWSNSVFLRKDIHSLFDQRCFAFVPKMNPGTGQYVYVVHVLRKDASQYCNTIQNRLVQHLAPDSRPLLFARFAWAILIGVKEFVTKGHERVVCIRTDVADDLAAKYEIKTVAGADLKQKYGGGGTLAAKRKRTEPEDDYEPFLNYEALMNYGMGPLSDCCGDSSDDDGGSNDHE